jgi:cell wall-associated NlpC family hydrolase
MPALVQLRLARLRRAAVAVLVVPLLVLGLPAPAQAAKDGFTSTRTIKKVDKIQKALKIAKQQQGDPYRWGATGPNAFDCSGLVLYSTRKAGIKGVPRTSSAQSNYMRKISRAAMRPGDFVFFHNGGSVYHVGIYSGWSKGRRMIVNAPSTGSNVRTDAIWTDSWFPRTLRGR